MVSKKRRTRTPRTPQNVALPTPPPLLKLHHDIMALIGDFLTPPDLLSLYRSCKNIRAFLAQDASRVIWQAARVNAEGIPPRPKWLDELQFIALLFDEHCNRCLAVDERSKEPIWPFFVRYCSACKVLRTTTKNPLQELPAGDYLAKFEADVFELFPGSLDATETDGELVETRIYHLPDIRNVQNKIVATMDWISSSASPSDAYARTMGLIAILEEKRSDTQARLEFAEQCRLWKEDWNRRQALRLKVMKSRRHRDIADKLVDLGYFDVVYRLGYKHNGFSDGILDLVDQARRLTEDEWVAIAPRIIAFAEHRKQLESRASYVRTVLLRLKDLQKALDDHRGELQAEEDGFPTVLDLLDVRDVTTLLSLPSGAIFLNELYVDRVPVYVTQWKKDRQDTLLSLHPGILPRLPSTPSPAPFATRSTQPIVPPLTHPAANFWCRACKAIVHSIVAMTHACCYGKSSGDHQQILTKLYGTTDGVYSRPIIAGDQLFPKTFLVFCGGYLPWSHSHLRSCVEVTRSVLAAGGNLVLDDLLKGQRAENFRVACKICSRAGTCVLAMGWRRAVAHAFDLHDGVDVPWVRVNAAMEAKVKHVEYRSRSLTSAAAEVCARWCCLRCPWPGSRVAHTWPQLSTHFFVDHPFTIMRDEDYRQSQDSPLSMPPAVLLVEAGSQNGAVEDLDQGTYVLARMKIPKHTWTSFVDDGN